MLAWQGSCSHLATAGETEHVHVVEDAAATEPHDGLGLAYLRQTAWAREKGFAALMETMRTHSLGRSVMRCMARVGVRARYVRLLEFATSTG